MSGMIDLEPLRDWLFPAHKIVAGMREAIDVAAGRPHNARVTFTAHEEFFVGGVRFAPGRYTIKRVDEPAETETPF